MNGRHIAVNARRLNVVSHALQTTRVRNKGVHLNAVAVAQRSVQRSVRRTNVHKEACQNSRFIFQFSRISCSVRPDPDGSNYGESGQHDDCQ
ncbi:MAG: hypothetical protein Fues2KO_46460 [Fuerstiella sp.]